MVNKSANKILWVMLIVVLVGIIAIYGVMFDSLSETSMIQLSYLWSGPLLYALVGLIAAYSGAKKPFLTGLIGLIAAPLLLFSFFEIFWEML